jgi:hypothetical protein
MPALLKEPFKRLLIIEVIYEVGKYQSTLGKPFPRFS